MSITYTLPGFPQINQLHEATSDGQPDENAGWNCVPASIADALGFLTGRQYNGDELKDAVYGQGYRGAQAPAAYVAYSARQGVALAAYDGTPAQLVARIHAEIAAGHPVIGTIPSQWGTPRDQQRSGYTTHVVCFCGDGPGALRADNPWIAPQWHDGDDAYWADRLCFGQVWVMAKAEEGTAAMAWHQQSNGTGKDDAGHTCGQGAMAYLAAHNLAGANGLMGETFYDGANSFLPLDNGHVVTAHHEASGQWTTDEAGAQALVAVWRQLQAAKAVPQNPPADPKAAAALQIIQALKALEGQL